MKYGPNTPAVEHLIQQAHTMTAEQAEKINVWEAASRAGWRIAWYPTLEVVQNADRTIIWRTARNATRNATRNTIWRIAGEAARDAVLALIARDLVSEEHFDALYGPWGSVFGPPVD